MFQTEIASPVVIVAARWSPEIIAALSLALATAMTGVGTLIASIRNGKRSEVADKKLDHITVLTNSTLTAANTRIDALEQIIRDLLAERQAMKGERGVGEMTPIPTLNLDKISAVSQVAIPTVVPPKDPKPVDPIVVSLLIPETKD